MDILAALKAKDMRLTYGNFRWLVWDNFLSWNVYERKTYAKKITLLISTMSLENAIDILVNGI